EKEDPKDLEGAAEFARALFWIGYGDKYFLGALAPEEADRDRVVGRIAQTPAGNVYASLVYPVAPIPAGESRAYRFAAYVGPKEIDRLKDAGHGLEYALDHGWFGFISRPMLQLLKVFHGWTGNWGLAIILLTVLVKALFYPLTKKSYTSMKEMQKLQPHMQRIKEQFKDNKEAMNREMMELYRRHKVNPFAGCMPIVLQIPVFFGLYKALLNSIEIRHAPFYFWIHDLSVKDPFYVTPLIMGATMFLQQKMTPSTMDPAQQRIMNLMPIFFTFLFLNFPAGLVIYWLVNNILSIAQQYAINKKAEAA
ncbi:MAG: membrane protein insertase YidC, partial [Candidatus Methylomirabilis sp.]|nr:membrane protein insertase YidC [Deltaproteobacteria bacterium]